MAPISSLYFFLCLIIQLIWSLQSPSFCPSFYSQVDTGQLCSPGASVNSPTIRGGTVLQEITSSVDQTTPVYGCINAWGLAQSDPSAAARTGDNYRVRV
jgi:hypothetical protein